ncbi:hypothetical protein Ami103574_00375 [Aminipila butyrica]|uniref:Uncharacterized protein n=1 Tax=Aminipila butyrica TaxID=433296 RepID=A0A858BQQ7_9FIRM|nr:hypothetical protein [Aminipila butyrica]QIB67857.1 hypothetical protein Ami103574_00375 [Aminipila butyrica]
MKNKTDSKVKADNRVETTPTKAEGIKSAGENKRKQAEFQSSMEQSDF